MEYHLEPWPEGELHRKIVTYSGGRVLDQRSQEAAFRRSLITARRMRALYPFIGLLPGEIQLAIARRYPIDLIAAVRWSCIAQTAFALYYLFAGGLLGALASVVESRDVSYVPRQLLGLPAGFWITIAPLLLADAFLRWRALARRGIVLGNLLLEFLARFIARD